MGRGGVGQVEGEGWVKWEGRGGASGRGGVGRVGEGWGRWGRIVRDLDSDVFVEG